MEVSVRAVRRIESLEEFELNKASKERFYSFVFGKIEGFNKLKSEIRKEALKPNEPLLFHGSKQGIEGGIDPKKSSAMHDFGRNLKRGCEGETCAQRMLGKREIHPSNLMLRRRPDYDGLIL